MDTVLDRFWTTDTFLAWEGWQEGKYEFEGREIIPMTGGSVAHQRVVFNLLPSLAGLLGVGERAGGLIEGAGADQDVGVSYPAANAEPHFLHDHLEPIAEPPCQGQ